MENEKEGKYFLFVFLVTSISLYSIFSYWKYMKNKLKEEEDKEHTCLGIFCEWVLGFLLSIINYLLSLLYYLTHQF